jgi:hypothetical protein
LVNAEGKRQLGKPRHGYEDNTYIYLKGIQREIADECICARKEQVMKRRVP